MEYAILAESLTKSYDSVCAVNNMTVKIRTGETFGLLGANGAGKTTLVECILGIKKPDAGQAHILGMHPAHSKKELFEQVGVQLQESRYQDRIKVGELCTTTTALYKESADYRQLLAQFGIAEKEKDFVSELSGGQRQKLFIVLALIPRPRVVFLDELTTGLDVKARREVWRYLASLKEEGITMLMTTHFMDEAETLCDRITIMRKGEAVFEGTVDGALESGDFASFEDAYLFYAEEGYYESL